MPHNIKISAAYLRVSTEEQAEYSLDAQLVEIRKYAASHGYLIPNEYVFVDEGISGKKTNKRNSFNRMIGAAKQTPKPFEAILLWKFSRFARNREDSIIYKSMLRRDLGIEVISISEPLADDKTSIIMEAIIEAMDEYYSINLAEEVKRGMTEKARRGDLQANPSFGYSVEHGVLVPVPEEAALVRAIFDRFIQGEGLFPIAKWLNDLGIKTHRGNRFENRTIEYILRNPVYIGKLRWNPSGRTRRDFANEHIILADAKHEPLITQALWDAAQLRMAEVKAQWKYHGRPISEHKDWLSGLVRCSNCGRTLVFSKPHYWKCNGYSHATCTTAQHVSDEKLKSMLLATMVHDQQSGTAIAFTLSHSKPESINELALLEEQDRQVTTKLSRLLDAYLAGVQDLTSYSAAKTSLEEQHSLLSARIAALKIPQNKKKADSIVKKNIKNCLLILNNPDADMTSKHNAVRSIIKNFVFDKAANSVTINYSLFLP